MPIEQLRERMQGFFGRVHDLGRAVAAQIRAVAPNHLDNRTQLRDVYENAEKIELLVSIAHALIPELIQDANLQPREDGHVEFRLAHRSELRLQMHGDDLAEATIEDWDRLRRLVQPRPFAQRLQTLGQQKLQIAQQLQGGIEDATIAQNLHLPLSLVHDTRQQLQDSIDHGEPFVNYVTHEYTDIEGKKAQSLREQFGFRVRAWQTLALERHLADPQTFPIEIARAFACLLGVHSYVKNGIAWGGAVNQFYLTYRERNPLLMALPADLTSHQLYLRLMGGGALGVMPPAPMPAPAPNGANQVPPAIEPPPPLLPGGPPVQLPVDPVLATIERLQDIPIVGIELEGVVRQIWAAIRAGKHVALSGAPGTAKTTIAEAVAHVASTTGWCNDYLFTTATTDWTAIDTIGGYFPDPDRGLVFRQGKFLDCFPKPGEAAAAAAAGDRWLVIDELNRADVDKAFGQFFTILSGQSCELPFRDERRRSIVVAPEEDGRFLDDEQFLVYQVPDTWRMLGTLNTDDKASLYEMSFAFLRRFAFIHVALPTAEGIRQIGREVLVGAGLTEAEIERLCRLWIDLIVIRPLGPAILIDMTKFLAERKALSPELDFGNILGSAIAMYVVPQLESLQAPALRRLRARCHADGCWTAQLEEFAIAFLPSMQDAIADADDYDANEGEDGADQRAADANE